MMSSFGRSSPSCSFGFLLDGSVRSGSKNESSAARLSDVVPSVELAVCSCKSGNDGGAVAIGVRSVRQSELRLGEGDAFFSKSDFRACEEAGAVDGGWGVVSVADEVERAGDDKARGDGVAKSRREA